jgi:hypothetical protein
VLAQQFPAHPPFDIEVKPGSLRRVRDVIRLATQTRDGRVEVERPFRDEVRRIAVLLRLGDMGETHFVLRDDWKSHFLRKKAEAKVTSLPVRQLRMWIDQPEAMGLCKDIQNLVIFSFALQNNLIFYLHGGPLESSLENLDDALELREQALPSEDLWQEAVQRAAAMLGIVPSPLLTAANVAKFAADVKATADQRRQGVIGCAPGYASTCKNWASTRAVLLACRRPRPYYPCYRASLAPARTMSCRSSPAPIWPLRRRRWGSL